MDVVWLQRIRRHEWITVPWSYCLIKEDQKTEILLRSLKLSSGYKGPEFFFFTVPIDVVWLQRIRRHEWITVPWSFCLIKEAQKTEIFTMVPEVIVWLQRTRIFVTVPMDVVWLQRIRRHEWNYSPLELLSDLRGSEDRNFTTVPEVIVWLQRTRIFFLPSPWMLSDYRGSDDMSELQSPGVPIWLKRIRRPKFYYGPRSYRLVTEDQKFCYSPHGCCLITEDQKTWVNYSPLELLSDWRGSEDWNFTTVPKVIVWL